MSMPCLREQNDMKRKIAHLFKNMLHENSLLNIKTILLFIFAKRHAITFKAGKKLTRPIFYGFAVYHFLLA